MTQFVIFSDQILTRMSAILDISTTRGEVYNNYFQKLGDNYFLKPKWGLRVNFQNHNRDSCNKCKRTIPARASFSPVSMSGILGTNTPGLSRTYMLG